MKAFSVIVPVYNRVDEIRELLDSLAAQTCRNFEVIIVEDGSTEPCREVVEEFIPRLDVKYYFKANEGRSIARNYGMEHSSGHMLVFFDSDCVIPPRYFETLSEISAKEPIDFFGGPDAAHESFTDTQKAINFAMTSFITTGGIRGGKVKLDKFVPRTFNMGFTREVYGKVGGFREMFSEDIDMSTRITQAGYRAHLIRECPVYHKRRVNLRKFWRQVHVFGMSRITLKLLYPGSLKAVHTLPAVAVVTGVALVLAAIFASPWYLLPLGVYLLMLFLAALASTRSVKIAAIAVPAGIIQICGYGTGFIKAWFTKILLGRGRDLNEEIALRKGK